MKKLFRAALVALMLVPNVGLAQNFDKGWAALEDGDYATALKEWLPLAEQGDAAAQSNLGSMYGTGSGVLQDYVEAVKWYRLAAEQGNAGAPTFLGNMYREGNGVLQDYAEAVKWFRKAAEQGGAYGQTNLGYMYKSGKGVIQDNQTAHMWYNIASANGNELGGTNRDKIAEKMTPAAIEEAQRCARLCMASNYTNCD
jgi:TPR repeat protein